jgi:L-rhamnono-1,4-lactonase
VQELYWQGVLATCGKTHPSRKAPISKPTMASSLPTTVPIIDAHIHLYPAAELSTIAWLEPGNPVESQHSIEEYKIATASCNENIKGFVFMEVDRKHDLDAGLHDGSGWEYPLMELEWVTRIALGTPREGEGHAPEHAELCLAIVPWAPVPNGREVMIKYVGLVEERAGAAWEKVRGYRYLVQQKERGLMLGDGFIESLRWLGTKGFVFCIGVDHHRDGDWQLEECLEMVRRAHEGVEDGEKVTFLIGMSRSLISSSASFGRGRIWACQHMNI